jgi:hypothetical protein
MTKYKGVPFKVGQRWRDVQDGEIHTIRHLPHEDSTFVFCTKGNPLVIEEIQDGSLRLLLDKGVCNENT